MPLLPVQAVRAVVARVKEVANQDGGGRDECGDDGLLDLPLGMVGQPAPQLYERRKQRAASGEDRIEIPTLRRREINGGPVPDAQRWSGCCEG